MPADQRLVLTLRFEVRPGEVCSAAALGDADRRPWLAEVLSALGFREVRHEMAGAGDAIEIERLLTGPVSAREDEVRGVFRRDGDSWTIGWESASVRVRHARGFAILAHLLRSPGEGIHVRLLDALSPSRGIAEAAPGAGHVGLRGCGDGGEMLDARALFEYRRRLGELNEELASAERDRDLGRIALARVEMDGISEQLRVAGGPGGRSRRSCSDVERLRISITKRIRVAIAEIGDRVPGLGHHLATSVRTGRVCTYHPSAKRRVRWDF